MPSNLADYNGVLPDLASGSLREDEMRQHHIRSRSDSASPAHWYVSGLNFRGRRNLQVRTFAAVLGVIEILLGVLILLRPVAPKIGRAELGRFSSKPSRR